MTWPLFLPLFFIVIVGDGPEEEAVKVSKLANNKNVIVHRGMVNQERLRVLYKAADFLVSASKFETLGMTVAEAGVCGTPVIVSRFIILFICICK